MANSAGYQGGVKIQVRIPIEWKREHRVYSVYSLKRTETLVHNDHRVQLSLKALSSCLILDSAYVAAKTDKTLYVHQNSLALALQDSYLPP
jgi:hypothetical protein